ncbi:P-loop NTPase fold protein [Pseudomonas alloputida]|uniref:P-loop NTPase fold protein n=1 Tax=Pseudomonas alloputida TaxID=1940621 RepID=UPI00386A1E36
MINFHSEKPAEQDLFPGGSHEKVASAMQAYITTPNASQVIGLDGEFGSGKSSILEMLGNKLKAADDSYRVWFFDCEQNYQGSTKSNFIELFTDQLLEDMRSGSKEAQALTRIRDLALGREFEYSKKTTSHVSAWALLLLASLFFSSSSFKEIFKLAQPAAEVATSLLVANWAAFLSPGIVLFFAWVCNHGRDVGVGKKWSLLSLFKGSSHDYINEKIEVSKEVTPLDLKRALVEQLKLVPRLRYVVILDNLDRLPKESLRSVWSDLEIFTSVASAKNLTVVVPFCSSKVAAYLSADADRKYDSRDFIAKKFPVVFRAPPVITSGWKDGFRQMWNHTFTQVEASIAEHCAQLLHRHSPMANGLVTPRLQKKFINDIATTSLVVGDHINLVCIAAHLLLCRYNEFPVEEILRTDGLSEEYKALVKLDESAVKKVAQTKTLLNSVIGQNMNAGWQIQILQVHFLTTSEIAIAELLDEPLRQAFQSSDPDKLYSLTSLFGFTDAFKRLLATRPPLSDLLLSFHAAHEKHGGDWAKEAMQQINEAALAPLPENSAGNAAFYYAMRYCITLGLNASNIGKHGKRLRASIEGAINKPYDASRFTSLRLDLEEYDLYLEALGEAFDPMTVESAECIMHLLALIERLNVIKPHDFSLDSERIETAYQQLACTENHLMDMVPLESDRVIPAVNWVFGFIRLGDGLAGGISSEDIAALVKDCSTGNASAIISLALAETIDQTVLNNVALLLGSDASDIARTVAAIVYIRNEDSVSLTGIAEIEDVLKSELFRSLANATLLSSEVLPLLLSEAVDAVAPLVANLIIHKSLGSLNCSWLFKNFSAVMAAIEPHGVTQQIILDWFNGWDIHAAKLASKPQSIDAALLAGILATPEPKFGAFKQGVFKFLDSSDRSEDDWKKLIGEASPQVVSIVHAMAQKSVPLISAATIGNAIVATLHVYVHEEDGCLLNAETGAMINALLQALDEQSRYVIGGRLRTLFYSDPNSISRLVKLIDNYGQLILDIQPVNSEEATRLIRLLDYIGRYPELAQQAATFLDGRADQLSKYRYSESLRQGMASVVTKLEKLTPTIFKRFARKSWFASFFKTAKSEQMADEVEAEVKD